MPPAIPLLLISGFLGAGKTTLVNRILQGSHGQRIAVLVNDFGAIDVDRRLIAAADGESLQLSNGCICCSIGSSLIEALLRLLARPQPPERLIIETSGVADPARVGAIGLAGDAFRLEAIVTLVDAETVRDRAEDPQIGATVRRQIEAADLLILNKTDLISPAAHDALKGWLRDLSPAPIVPAVEAAIPEALLLDIPPQFAVPSASGPTGDHADYVAAVTLSPEAPIRREHVPDFAETVATMAWRAKGFLSLAETPDRLSLLQIVGRRWSLAPAPADATTGLVVIGPRATLDLAALTLAFHRASAA